MTVIHTQRLSDLSPEAIQAAKRLYAPVPALPVDCVGNYPALECPLCGKARKPRTLNKDRSVTYSCAPDHVNHGSQYTWRIAADGTLID